MAKVIDGLYYSETHEYVKVEGKYAYNRLCTKRSRKRCLR